MRGEESAASEVPIPMRVFPTRARVSNSGWAEAVTSGSIFLDKSLERDTRRFLSPRGHLDDTIRLTQKTTRLPPKPATGRPTGSHRLSSAKARGLSGSVVSTLKYSAFDHQESHPYQGRRLGFNGQSKVTTASPWVSSERGTRRRTPWQNVPETFAEHRIAQQPTGSTGPAQVVGSYHRSQPCRSPRQMVQTAQGSPVDHLSYFQEGRRRTRDRSGSGLRSTLFHTNRTPNSGLTVGSGYRIW